MKMAWVIAKRDFGTYFKSPIGYLMIAFFMGTMGFMFLPYLAMFQQQASQYQMMGRPVSFTDQVVKPLYGNLSVILLFLLPLVTMRLFSEEKKLHTIELLMTSPLTLSQIVLGKFLSTLLFLGTVLGLTLIFPLSLYWVGTPDFGPIFGSYLGLMLLGGSFCALGIFFSAMTENQIVSAALGFLSLLFLWIVNWVGNFANPVISEILDHISLIKHVENLMSGVIVVSDVVYYLSFIGFFLYLTYRVLDSYRWR